MGKITYSGKYSSGDEIKLLIHMDDMGMDYAANEAGKQIYSEGIGTSSSIIMQAAWAKEFADWWKDHPQYDIGIHLSQTSEWDVARWRPLSGQDECPSLYDDEGFMHKGLDEETAYKGSFADYCKEVDRQVALAGKWGVKPTHLDSHMITDWREDDRFVYYINKAVEEDLMICISDGMLWNDQRVEFAQKMLDSHDNIVYNPGYLDFGMGEDYEKGVEEFIAAVEALEPGFYTYTVHPVIETDSIKRIIPSWRQRVNEAKLLLDARTRKAIERKGVKLVGWKDLK